MGRCIPALSGRQPPLFVADRRGLAEGIEWSRGAVEVCRGGLPCVLALFFFYESGIFAAGCCAAHDWRYRGSAAAAWRARLHLWGISRPGHGVGNPSNHFWTLQGGLPLPWSNRGMKSSIGSAREGPGVWPVFVSRERRSGPDQCSEVTGSRSIPRCQGRSNPSTGPTSRPPVPPARTAVAHTGGGCAKKAVFLAIQALSGRQTEGFG